VVGHDRNVAMIGLVGLADVATRAGLDGLLLAPVPMAPEIMLYQAADPIVFWARLEAAAGRTLPAPFWASAWLGGQALARFVLDRPDEVAGRRVLDLAAGSGVAGIAACMAGADQVIANDTDPYAAAAIALNAGVNAVDVTVSSDDILDGPSDVHVVLAGDVFYDPSVAAAVLPFLERAQARGARVLIGDPGRANLPLSRLALLATFPTSGAAASVDAEIEHVHVLRLI
jgi:predicted nicotinamide N-methyase